tara:strand:- start:59803 stop:61512 length:1710 start_codon:yes stop_codon:yes gene_type:complete
MKAFALAALMSISVVSFATTSLGIENSNGYTFQLTKVNAGGTPNGYCAADGKGAPCTASLGPKGQQWTNLDGDNSTIDLEYDVNLASGQSVGHVGVSITHQSVTISNVSAGASATVGPFTAGQPQAIIFKSAPKPQVDFSKISNNMIDVANAYVSHASSPGLLANQIPFTSAQEQADVSGAQWALQFGYDATRFPLWLGAYCMTNASSAECVNSLTLLKKYVVFAKTHTCGNGVLPDNGWWAQSVSGHNVGDQVAPATCAASHPALAGPTAVAAYATAQYDFATQLLNNLYSYDLGSNTPASAAGQPFGNSSAPYFNAAIKLISLALIAGNGSLDLTGSTVKQDVKAKFTADYQEWLSATNGFVVSGGANTSRVVFSAENAPGVQATHPSPTVSEGMGYGLLIAYAANDQATFNKFLTYTLNEAKGFGCAALNGDGKTTTECKVKTNYLMPWIVDGADGKPFFYTIGGGYYTSGSASDADIQIAWAVSLAEQRWGNNAQVNGQNYGQILSAMKQEIASFDVNMNVPYSLVGYTYDQLLAPGSQWDSAGVTVMYPGYATPQAFAALQAAQ